MSGADKVALLRDIIDQRKIRPVFQPILDLFSGNILGYEILSRGVAPMEAPLLMFQVAKQAGMTWDLERACRIAAIEAIANLPEPIRSERFFINVSPRILSDPRFVQGFTLQQIQKNNLDPNQIVFEITEQESIDDYARFESLIQHYVHQGFRIALDDFGAGHSGLTTMIAASPHYIKLDREMVRDLHRSSYKQLLLRSITSLATNLESTLIAEGVETWEDVEILTRYGIRYCQGFLFQRPQPSPMPVDRGTLERIQEVSMAHNYAKTNLDQALTNLVVTPKTYEEETMLCEDVEDIFRKRRELDHLVFVKNKRPTGLITRVSFYLQTGGRFGFSLFQQKSARYLYKKDMLVVNEKISIAALAKLVMDRHHEDLYDPVLVVNAKGDFVGTVTIKQLIVRATALEVQSAMGSNPLTNLPGNRAIQTWIQEIQGMEAFSIIYIDLDRFKEYNDVYGFMMGDEMLRLTARTLTKHIQSMSESAMLGHIGGDDFIIVSPTFADKDILERICEDFDREKEGLFDPRTVQRGYYTAITRAGVKAEVPLVTLSLAVIESTKLGSTFHPGMLSKIAASLKKRTKKVSAETGRSNYLFEQRDVRAEVQQQTDDHQAVEG